MNKPGALAQLLAWRRQVGRTLNLMVGMPEYGHLCGAHESVPPGPLRDEL